MEETGATHDQGPGDDHTVPTGTVQLPAPTAWPMVLCLGDLTDACRDGDALGDQSAGDGDGVAGDRGVVLRGAAGGASCVCRRACRCRRD